MSDVFKDDQQLFGAVRERLFVALVGDALDKLGLQHQFLGPEIKPLRRDLVILGRAMPVLEADFPLERYEGHGELSGRPFGFMFEALDDLQAGEVYICSGASPRYALWGGLMSVRAMQCGAAGAVVHGYHRDSRDIERLQFPVASFGSYAQDQGPRGKVLDWRIPIEMDGVRVCPGDVVYGDRDGVLIVPAAAVEDAFTHAFEKASTEDMVMHALRDGMTSVAAFRRYGAM